jgi:hypothetical protein
MRGSYFPEPQKALESGLFQKLALASENSVIPDGNDKNHQDTYHFRVGAKQALHSGWVCGGYVIRRFRVR